MVSILAFDRCEARTKLVEGTVDFRKLRKKGNMELKKCCLPARACVFPVCLSIYQSLKNAQNKKALDSRFGKNKNRKLI
jgi:hypothetical protein